MKQSIFKLFIVSGLSIICLSANAFAGAKQGFADTMVTLQPAKGVWTTLYTTYLQTSSGKTIYASLSTETGLYTSTQTTVKNNTSTGGTTTDTESSSANASIKMRVLVDGVPAAPGEVVMDKRLQSLSTSLTTTLSGCTTFDATNLANGTCSFTLSQILTIQMILDTMSAHSFNFALTVGQGTHTIQVQALVETSLDNTAGGSSSANALIGKTSLGLEEFNLIPNRGGIASF